MTCDTKNIFFDCMFAVSNDIHWYNNVGYQAYLCGLKILANLSIKSISTLDRYKVWNIKIHTKVYSICRSIPGMEYFQVPKHQN